MKHLNEPPQPPSELAPGDPAGARPDRPARAREGSRRSLRGGRGVQRRPRPRRGGPAGLARDGGGRDVLLAGVPRRSDPGDLAAATRPSPRRRARRARPPAGLPARYGYRSRRPSGAAGSRGSSSLLLLAAAVVAGWYVYTQIQDELARLEARGRAARRRAPGGRGRPSMLEEAGFEVERRARGRPEGRRRASSSTRIPTAGRALAEGRAGHDPRLDRRAEDDRSRRSAGLTYEDAVDDSPRRGLEGEARGASSPTSRSATVISQDPKPETHASSRARPSTLRVSKGQESATVPDVLGQDEASARGRAPGGRLQGDRQRGAVRHGGRGPRRRARTRGADTSADKGSTVAITVSTGPESVTVPDVVGRSQRGARGRARGSGFEVEVDEQETNDPTQDDVVLDQNPSGGVQAEPGEHRADRRRPARLADAEARAG